MQFFRNHPKRILGMLTAALIALLCLALLGFSDPYDGKILPNTYIADYSVGGMTRIEAAEALKPLAARFAQEAMVVSLPKETLRLLPEDTKAVLNISGAVKAAYAYGRTGTKAERNAAYEASLTHPNIIALEPYVRWNEGAIRSALEAYGETYDTTLSESTYALEGTMPDLAEHLVSSDTAPQTLVLNLGIPAQALDVGSAYHQIQDAYNQGHFLVTIETSPQALPTDLDLDAIHQQLHIAPTDAALDRESHQILPASYGYGFDLEAARQQLQLAAYGDTLSIPMELLSPTKCSDDMYYQDVLGSYISGHSDRPNIVKNLQLVCQALDGIILQPGAVFSYNDAVGERTVERGFLYGESFSGMEESRSPGGGVCQGSSVLHVCVLEADLEVVERVNHGLTVGYTPLGQDAAVSWGGPDFRFRNSTHFPIRICAEYTDKDIRFQLLGTDEKDYYIELEATQGHDNHQIYANCYKRKYDKATGTLISRELAAHSAYLYTGN